MFDEQSGMKVRADLYSFITTQSFKNTEKTFQTSPKSDQTTIELDREYRNRDIECRIRWILMDL